MNPGQCKINKKTAINYRLKQNQYIYIYLPQDFVTPHFEDLPCSNGGGTVRSVVFRGSPPIAESAERSVIWCQDRTPQIAAIQPYVLACDPAIDLSVISNENIDLVSSTHNYIIMRNTNDKSKNNSLIPIAEPNERNCNTKCFNF